MRNILFIVSMFLFAGLACAWAGAAGTGKLFEKTAAFTALDGKSIYEQNCAGCHMPKGEGAKGAGMYPHLAKNPNVENPAYTGYVILNGLRGMPSFDAELSDEQVAAVANHVGTTMGNKAGDRLAAEDAKASRPSERVEYIDW